MPKTGMDWTGNLTIPLILNDSYFGVTCPEGYTVFLHYLPIGTLYTFFINIVYLLFNEIALLHFNPHILVYCFQFLKVKILKHL